MLDSVTYPTFTHVPPRRLFSTAIVLAPYMPLALRAQARPPLPPPMTKKSHSFGIGAMTEDDEENCRVRVYMRFAAAVLEEAARMRREGARGDSLSVFVGRSRSGGGRVQGLTQDVVLDV